MRKLTDLIKENLQQMFKYEVKLQVFGMVQAENEGAAGELVDKEMDELMENINSETGTYEIVSIDPISEFDAGTTDGHIGEKFKIDNNKVLESIDIEEQKYLNNIVDDVLDYLANSVSKLSDDQIDYIYSKIQSHITETVATPENDTSNDELNTKYGTKHLSDQGVSLGEILTDVSQLTAGTTYCIVDLGLNEWNGGYKWLRKDGATFVFKDELSDPSEPKDIIFTDEEMSGMIENGQIAFEA